MNNQALATVEEMRAALPAPVQARGIEPHVWNALKGTVYPGASDDMALAAFDYCHARKLDPIKKPVHIVSVYDVKTKGYVETIWEGIASLRTTAMRTGEYAGKDSAEFGPEVTAKIGAENVTFLEWCQVTVYRLVAGVRCPFPGPKVFFIEAVATKKGGVPNAMWNKRPRGQLEKCAEAAALRSAFPEEIGGMISAEEADGREMTDVTPTERPQRADFEQPAISAPKSTIDAVKEADPALQGPAPETESGGLWFIPLEGESHTYARAGDWLNALESAAEDTGTGDDVWKLWERNQKTFNEIQTRSKKPEALARCKEVADYVAMRANNEVEA
jgi:phage recombination protein Bet